MDTTGEETTETAPSERETYVFSRSQLKYGLERDSYLSRWLDRPLYLDPSLAQKNPEGAMLNPASYERIREIVRKYKLDGFAFFPETSGRQLAYNIPADDDFLLLTEFTSIGDEAAKMAIAELAMENPRSFRIDGKLVISSYRAESKSPEYWKDLFAKLREKHGDQFIFLPALNTMGGTSISTWVEKHQKGEITPEDETQIKESLRIWRDATDGLYFASPASVKKGKEFDADCYRNFIGRILREVIDEAAPEPKKYLALAANVGHENVTRFGYTQNCRGTKTLRDSFEAALAHHPLLINIPEWDEQNENTSLRPTVYNSLSSLRIIRHYMTRLRGEQISPLESDDTTIPNLIVSYRKLLTLGELLDVEILNIPDGVKTTPVEWTIQFRLVAPDGTLGFESETFLLATDKMQDQRIAIPTETLTASAVWIPELYVTSPNQKPIRFSEGLHHIELRPTTNWDYKWVKQPLRDLLSIKKADFQVSAPNEDGTVNVQVDIESNEPLAYVDIVDSGDVVYQHANETEILRESEEHAVFSLNWQAFEEMFFSGSLKITGSDVIWDVPLDRSAKVTENEVVWKNERSNHWPRRLFFSIPKKNLDQAILSFNVPDIFQGEISLRQLFDQEALGIPYERGGSFILSRYVRQSRIPLPLHTSAVRFEVPVLPDMDASTLQLQLVGMSGRTWRSRPWMADASAAENKTIAHKRSVQVYSDAAGESVSVNLEATTPPEIIYTFSPERGSVLHTKAGRPFWGALGGYVTQVTERGGGESADGTPFIRRTDYPKDSRQSAPAWHKEEDGSYSLSFDGTGNYVAFPQGVIPRRSAFTIEMEIFPLSDNKRQTLLAHRSYYPGSFTFVLNNGEIEGSYSGEIASLSRFRTGLRVIPEQWNRLQFCFDGSNIFVILNDTVSAKQKVHGLGLYDTVSVLGGFGEDWFHGRIKNLRIAHSIQKSAK